MALLKFDDFVFDSERFQLACHGEPLALRPKALKLLHLLIENRHRVVPKAEIFSSIWGSNYARDHLLFQLISELRKPPFNATYVRTLPNEGYQWNVSTANVSNNIPKPMRIAASLVLGITLVAGIYQQMTPENSSAKVSQLPALSAFSKGVVAMESGDNDEAVEWFKFALHENPDSIESSLFLAESLLLQNKPEESSKHIQILLQKNNLDAYNKMTATELLSRIRQKQGLFIDALRYAKESNDTNVVAQCSVDVVAQRVEFLEDKLGVLLAAPHSKPVPNVDVKVSRSIKYQHQCEQLKKESDKTSYCAPEFGVESFAYYGHESMFVSV